MYADNAAISPAIMAMHTWTKLHIQING